MNSQALSEDTQWEIGVPEKTTSSQEEVVLEEEG